MDNPFFAPFAAPDGTTRRPIVERVPECRPCRAPFWHLDEPTVWRWRNHTGTDQPSLQDWPIHPDDALALCRCAVDDWLRYTGGVMAVDLKDAGDNKVSVIMGMAAALVDGDKAPAPTPHEGHSIHDALNAAAHATADSLEIPP